MISNEIPRRDRDKASFTEMVPINSGKINIWRAPFFFIGSFLTIVAVSLFELGANVLTSTTIETFYLFSFWSIVLLRLLLGWVVFLYSRTDRTAFYMIVPTLITSLMLHLNGPLDSIFGLIARPFLSIASNVVLNDFLEMVLRVGLKEEFIKAAIIFIGVAIVLNRDALIKIFPSRLVDLLTVRSPLDGVLMGVTAGAAFILQETGNKYVPDAFIHGTDIGMKLSHDSILAPYAGVASGMMLLLPRVLSGLGGHMAWTGIFGYFIGLVVIRPRRWPLLIGIGWLSTALLHGLWDSELLNGVQIRDVHVGTYLVAFISFVIFASCLLKARQLEKTLFARGSHGRSILIDHPPSSLPPAPAHLLGRTGARLSVGGIDIQLSPFTNFDLGSIPKLGEQGRGVRGSIVEHPEKKNVLGVKNIGASRWEATLSNGEKVVVEPGKNLRLSNKTLLDFGDGLLGLIMVE